MIVSVKFRSIAIVVAVILVVAAAIGAITVTTVARPKDGKIVVLDAGHGGIDGGVVGTYSGTAESEVNLAITKAVKGLLEDAGYRVVLTRKNSEGLYKVGDSNKKLADLAKRRDIIRGSGADMVVSIHQNFYPLQSVSGAQVFYAPSSEVSHEYADRFQNMLNAGTNGRRVAMRGDYYILQCSEIPSVLVECGFLSNPVEEKLLVSAEYQQKIGYLIFSAIHGILMDGNSSLNELI